MSAFKSVSEKKCNSINTKMFLMKIYMYQRSRIYEWNPDRIYKILICKAEYVYEKSEFITIHCTKMNKSWNWEMLYTYSMM